jgi:dienelactone hydrolase
MRLFWCPLLLVLPSFVVAEELPVRVRPEGQKSDDARLGAARTLNDYFPFTPPKTKEEWEARRREVREHLLVALGLWPLPEKTPLNPVIHGKIDRDEYTIEKVFFASLPGHYVSGNLYRPKNKSGKLPGVLCPHGHWANGRFYDAGDKGAKAQIDLGADKTSEGAHYPLQARCAMLARMGCVVFHYDMVGVADSKQFAHTAGFTAEKDEKLKVETELWQQSFMGLQTWNSIRALDFLTSLPDVDPNRIGVTGASGGGTQTFILCAIDDRPAVAFPAVMVSTAMQGGCICENCSYLRVGTGNVEIAGLFAPKPLAMSCANDWTRETETKGLPELKALYKLYGAEDNVTAKHFSFEHNYNQVSREMMYNWFNKHLRLGWPEPVVEKPFIPVPPTELSVYDAEHPRPADATGPEGVRKWFGEQSEKQMAALFPKDAAALGEFKKVVGVALREMVGRFPTKEQVTAYGQPKESKFGDYTVHRAIFGHKDEGDRIPSIGLVPKDYAGTIVIWAHPQGKASLFENGQVAPAVKALLGQKIAVMAPDVLMTGEQTGSARAIDKRYAGYTFGYNRPLIAEQVRDVVTAVALAKYFVNAERVYIIGWDKMGPAAIMARAVCGPLVARCAADMAHSRFDTIERTDDPRLLPGALKYGGLAAFAALNAPGEIYSHNHAGTSSGKIMKAAYDAAGAANRSKRQPQQATPEQVVEWLAR